LQELSRHAYGSELLRLMALQHRCPTTNNHHHHTWSTVSTIQHHATSAFSAGPKLSRHFNQPIAHHGHAALTSKSRQHQPHTSYVYSQTTNSTKQIRAIVLSQSYFSPNFHLPGRKRARSRFPIPVFPPPHKQPIQNPTPSQEAEAGTQR
jgi:hypothetical protein